MNETEKSMPPKVKVQRTDIINAAISLVREGGEASLNARDVAARLNCSTQPIFSNFADMESLKCAVIKEAEAIFERSMNEEILSGKYPPYKASGMAYIKFAKEERELFRLLYMRSREIEKEDEGSGLWDMMGGLVRENTGLSGDAVNLFHLEMWSCVHGIAVMMATGYFELDWETVSRILTDVYQGLKKRCGTEK
jgi:AcrR family transcriptional regulator